MRVTVGAAILALWAALSGDCRGQSELTSLKNADGKAIEARLLRAIGDRIKLARADGKEFIVPIESFSEESQQVIRDWIRSNPAAVSYSFVVREEDKQTRAPVKLSLAGFDHFFLESYHYKVFIENRAANALTDLTARYRVFVDNRVHMNNGSVTWAKKLDFQPGESEIKYIGTNSSTVISTETVTLERARAALPVFGGRKNERDRLRGVWLRLFKSDEMIYEWKSELVPEAASWPEEEKKAEE